MFERSHDHDNSSSTNCGRDILSGEYKNQGYRPKYDYTHPSYPLTPSSLVALLTMPPKRSQKQPPPTPAPGMMEDAPASKLPSRTAWKTGEQLEYMQTRWSSFLTHQNKGHWGRGGLETNENILSTLQALVEGTHHLPANNRLGTF